jgi:hypothetical protein
VDDHKNKIGFRAVGYIAIFALAGIFFIYRGVVVSNNWKEILGGVLLLALSGVILWVNLTITQYQNKPIEERIKNDIFVKIRQFLRNTLIPLGFDENQHEDFGLGYYVKYTLGDLSVSFSYDIREKDYSFSCDNKATNKPISILYQEKDREQLINDVHTKLDDWLKEQNKE